MEGPPKSLIATKSVWFPLISWLVSTAVARFGLDLDAAESSYVADAISFMVVIVVRYSTHAPIGSILPQKVSNG